MERIVLAFDIEKAGASDKQPIIGIGASVVKTLYPKGEGEIVFAELDRLFLPGYFPGVTLFEPRCWETFWSKNLEQLEQLEYKGDLTPMAREREMIHEFQAFRKKWSHAELVTDNNVFDGGFINDLIFRHTPNMPLPYTTEGEYSSFFETFSQQRGLLMAVDPEYVKKSNWGYSDRIKKLYNVPEIDVVHDHNPANDAFTIACDQLILYGIMNGNIVRQV